MKNAGKNKDSRRNLSVISAILGLLGAINSIAIGFYLLSTLFHPILITIGSTIQGYILAPIISAINIMLIYGSYLILKNKNMKKGAKINLIAGLVLAFLYIFYAYVSQPPLLSWFFPGGILLIIPPILSGIIGKIASG
ncbi:MAG: hypothetical protein QW175_07800 [Candidatus Bathyarchaeia archaeon]